MSNRGGRPRKGHPGDLDLDSGIGNPSDTTLSADRGVYFSADGLTRRDELLNIIHKKRRLDPTKLNDRLTTWIPVPEDSFDAREDFSPGDEAQAEMGNKRKRYESSVCMGDAVVCFCLTFIRMILWASGDH